MTRDEAQQFMSRHMYELLGKMFSMFARWAPQIGYPRTSAGLATGGVVGYESADEMDLEADMSAIKVLEAGWDELSPAEQTAIQQVTGHLPWAFGPREEVLMLALEKLDRRMRMIGL